MTSHKTIARVPVALRVRRYKTVAYVIYQDTCCVSQNSRLYIYIYIWLDTCGKSQNNCMCPYQDEYDTPETVAHVFVRICVDPNKTLARYALSG